MLVVVVIIKNGDGKPTTATATTLTANATDITSTTIDTDTNNTIYRLHTILEQQMNQLQVNDYLGYVVAFIML
jgi:hypothetical protein